MTEKNVMGRRPFEREIIIWNYLCTLYLYLYLCTRPNPPRSNHVFGSAELRENSSNNTRTGHELRDGGCGFWKTNVSMAE